MLTIPKYNQPPRMILKEEISRMIDKTNGDEHKNLLRIQWIFGKRPKETLSLTRDSFEIDGDILRLRLLISKRRKTKGIIGINQKLVINEVSISQDPFVKELTDYIMTIPFGQPLFSFKSVGNVRAIFYVLTACGSCPDCQNHKKCRLSIPPYFSRHSRATQLGNIPGTNVKDLMDWNGWDNVTTAGKYLLRDPVVKFKGKIS